MVYLVYAPCLCEKNCENAKGSLTHAHLSHFNLSFLEFANQVLGYACKLLSYDNDGDMMSRECWCSTTPTTTALIWCAAMNRNVVTLLKKMLLHCTAKSVKTTSGCNHHNKVCIYVRFWMNGLIELGAGDVFCLLFALPCLVWMSLQRVICTKRRITIAILSPLRFHQLYAFITLLSRL